MSLERAVLRHPVDGVREWLAFADPVDSWEADELSDVKDVLDAAEAANRRGLWVVGMVSYDAGPAFDTALRSLRAEDVPLASFAAFETPITTTLPRFWPMTQARPLKTPKGMYGVASKWSSKRLTSLRT